MICRITVQQDNTLVMRAPHTVMEFISLPPIGTIIGFTEYTNCMGSPGSSLFCSQIENGGYLLCPAMLKDKYSYFDQDRNMVVINRDAVPFDYDCLLFAFVIGDKHTIAREMISFPFSHIGSYKRSDWPVQVIGVYFLADLNTYLLNVRFVTGYMAFPNNTLYSNSLCSDVRSM